MFLKSWTSLSLKLLSDPIRGTMAGASVVGYGLISTPIAGQSVLRSTECEFMFSNMAIGWVGYAKGSAEVGSIVEISAMGMFSPDESISIPPKGGGGNVTLC